MIRIGRRIGFPVPGGPGLAISLMLGLSFGLAGPSYSEAAKLDRFLSAQDLAGRMVLDQNGQQIQLPTASDRHPELAKGSTPTYLAIPLYGSEHLPASIPTLETGSQQGENPVGPLNFDAIVKSNLNIALGTSKLAVVDTPTQNYLVGFLPGRAHSGTSLDNAVGTASDTLTELTHLINTGSAPFTKLTQSGVNDLEKFLHISSKTSTLTPSLNLEPQILNGDVLPAALPEPSTWMVFASLIAGVALFQAWPRGGPPASG
jgi:hypothetical protein